MDHTEGTAAASSPLFAMSGDGVDDIKIPMVFLFREESRKLMKVGIQNLIQYLYARVYVVRQLKLLMICTINKMVQAIL